MSALRLSVTAEVGRRFVPRLRRQIRAAHRLLQSSRLGELSIALVSDKTISRLHRDFMQVAGTTDVITFPLELDPSGCIISGEIVLCVPQAVRQAKIRHTKVDNEILLYAVHGLLHLHGLDDRTARGYRHMHRMEDLILTRLGIGPVFAPQSGALE